MRHPWLTLCGRIARVLIASFALVALSWAATIVLTP